MMERLGFIGLGIMGKPMATNLLTAGYPLVVHDINRTAVNELVEKGAKGANSPTQVAQNCEVVITMLPDSPEVEEVVLGENGLLESAPPEMIIIDMSSINPMTTVRMAKEAQKKGVRMLDAPVSGGEPGAIAGSLAIMVGGNRDDFERCKNILEKM
jgi:2-hydroxy-3-oxopropionate reductase